MRDDLGVDQFLIDFGKWSPESFQLNSSVALETDHCSWANTVGGEDIRSIYPFCGVPRSFCYIECVSSHAHKIPVRAPERTEACLWLKQAPRELWPSLSVAALQICWWGCFGEAGGLLCGPTWGFSVESVAPPSINISPHQVPASNSPGSSLSII